MPDYPVMDFATFKKKGAEGTLFTEFNHNQRNREASHLIP